MPAKKRLWECRARSQGKGGRACFGDSEALDQLMMTVNLHPKGLKSVIKYVHTFLLDFQSRETGVYDGKFCCTLLETGQNVMALLNGECALQHKAILSSKRKKKPCIFLYRNLFIDYCMYNSPEVAYFFLQSGAKKLTEFCGKVM